MKSHWHFVSRETNYPDSCLHRQVSEGAFHCAMQPHDESFPASLHSLAFFLFIVTSSSSASSCSSCSSWCSRLPLLHSPSTGRVHLFDQSAWLTIQVATLLHQSITLHSMYRENNSNNNFPFSRLCFISVSAVVSFGARRGEIKNSRVVWSIIHH